MILTGLTACDNVEWEGVEFRLQAPSGGDTAAVAAIEEDDSGPPPLEVDPALYLVDRSGPSPRLFPVALLGDDGLHPLPGPDEVEDFPRRFARERMAPERRFVLFSNGARVGAFYPDAAPPAMLPSLAASSGEVGPAEPDSLRTRPPPGTPTDAFRSDGTSGPWCATRPSVTGWIELLPDIDDATPLLALPADLSSERPHGSYVEPASTRDQRAGALNVASALFMQEEIVWPPDIVEARADMTVFRIPGAPEEFLASTFLYGDRLATGSAPPNAYSLFFIGEPEEEGRFRPTFFRYSEVGADGKAAPRFLAHADWNGDGQEDILLEVFGQRGRWFSALTRDDGGWQETYAEGCAAPAAGTLTGSEASSSRVVADAGP